MDTGFVSKIAGYKVISKLGSGGQSNIFLGQNASGEFFAIKVFTSLSGFSTEVVNLKKFEHPNIIKIIEFDADGKKIVFDVNEVSCSYIVLEAALAGNLYDFI